MATYQQLQQLLNNPNARQMLDIIAKAEGVKHGYSTIFGNERMSSLQSHPNIRKSFRQTDGKSNVTTAAGRYQFLKGTWDGVARQYGLKDFSPQSQDIAALALLAQNGALPYVLKGDFQTAVKKSGGTWASLPSSPYAQPKKSWGQLGLEGNSAKGSRMQKANMNDLHSLFKGVPTTQKANITGRQLRPGFASDIPPELRSTAPIPQGRKVSSQNSNLASMNDLHSLFTAQKRANYTPPDTSKATNKKTQQEQLKKQGPTQFWESGLLGLADIGIPVVQAAEYAADGIRGGINKVFGTNLETDRYEKLTKSYKNINDNHNTVRKANKQGADVTRMGANMLLTAPIAGAGGTLKSGVPLVSKAGAEFLGKNAALGALVGATGVHENNTERLKSMRNGAIGGAVGGAVGKKLGDGVAKAINIKQGRMAPAAQEVDELGKKFNVKTSVGDVGRNPIIQKTEVTMESIPAVGTSKFRQNQQNQVKDAAAKVVEQLKTKLDDVDYKAIPKIQAAANAGDVNAARIMKVVNGAGDDTGKILQAAAEIKNWRGKRVASQMYDRVQNLAGDGAIAPNKTVQKIDDIIAKDSKVTPNKALQKELLDIRKNLVDMNIKKDFKEMRATQSNLGKTIKKWGIAGEDTTALTKVKTAIDDDLLDFAQSSGNTKLLGELKRANALYKQLQDGKDKAFAKALRSAEPDQVFDQFMKSGKGDKAANFYKNLDPKGQAALRYQMAENAFGKAWDPNKEVFSPAKFAQEFERMKAPYNNIFTGGDKAQMDGFVKLMRHVERAGQYAENPPTGNRVIPYLLGGAAVMEPTSIATTGGIAGSLKLLFTTEAGKRILLAAKDVPPNSPQMANLLMQAQKLAVAGGATVGVKTAKD
ncbi:glycoside hydrolase family 104 protein [Acinetobacter sp. 256-1]|uniref:glycoside hydrolase family 24 protein n=1 Tax=Acinetobacter sp. 256-1 TaxID=2746721 RepID=UPI00257574D6|nr:glycoside hydrolase family 104 protein [Acinetobacter sp. 256-1]